MSPELARFGEIMAAASKIALAEAGSLQVDHKPDGSLVTNADRTVETFLRGALTDVSASSIHGEEFGRDAPSSEYEWFVDPIDGTTNFAFGSPLWGISVALVGEAGVELGAITLPALGEHYLAERGGGAWKDGRTMPRIASGPILASDPISACPATLATLNRATLVGNPRCSGAYVIDGAFVATGRYRGLIGRNERLYDVAAALLICQELGSVARYLNGADLDLGPLRNGTKIAEPYVIWPSNAPLPQPLAA